MEATTLESLRALVGEEAVRLDEAARERYGRDETEELFFAPAAVVLPATTDEVAGVLRLANAVRLAVTPRGGGTGLSGGALPVMGGLVLSLERLDRIRQIDEVNLSVEVEAGVVTAKLQARVEGSGLFYPPDPASRDSCLIGGNIAEDSAGPRSCKYGSTRRYVMGLEGVLADGTPFVTGTATRKNVAGYNLTQLLVGSEGTLAVITAATLRLLALPRSRLAMAFAFDSLSSAASCVATILRGGHDPAACELLDERALDLVGALEPLPFELANRAAAILVELDGESGETLLERASSLAGEVEGRAVGEPLVAVDVGDQRRLWRLRERVAEAVRRHSSYKEADTVVPVSRLAEWVTDARDIAARHALEAVCYGHAGDGNLHVNLLRGALDEPEWKRRRDAAETELFERVVELGGTVTGEHGIGFTQRRFLPLVEGPVSRQVMLRIKRALDPNGILNPGKIFPG